MKAWRRQGGPLGPYDQASLTIVLASPDFGRVTWQTQVDAPPGFVLEDSAFVGGPFVLFIALAGSVRGYFNAALAGRFVRVSWNNGSGAPTAPLSNVVEVLT